MKHDDLTDLTALWQSQTPAQTLDIEALQRRYRRQRWLMRFNIGIEVMTLLAASIFTLWALASEMDLLTKVWMSVITLWGWALFVPLNMSRWRSFNLMKSKSLHDSIQDHIRLTEQEILRWRLSLYGTALLIIVFVVLLIFALLTQCCASSDLFINALVTSGLSLLCYWFYRNQKACEAVRKTLSD